MNLAPWQECADAGMTAQQAADFLGRSLSAARQASMNGVKFARQRNSNLRRFVKADPARIRELASEGHSQSTIASILGVSRERIRQICDRDGIETLPGLIDWDRRDKLDQFVGAKITAKEAARLAGYTNGAATFRMAGLEPPRKETNIDRYRECAEAGMTLAETSRKFGAPISQVWKECKRGGVVFTARHRRKVERKFWSDDENRLLLSLSDAGQTNASLAKRFGVSATAIGTRVYELRRKAGAS